MSKEEMLEIVKKINTQLEGVHEEVQQALSGVTEKVDPWGRLAAADYGLDILQKGLKFYEYYLEEGD